MPTLVDEDDVDQVIEEGDGVAPADRDSSIPASCNPGNSA
jgi:hypothetical protein